MPRRQLKKWLPGREQLRTGWASRLFEGRLGDPDLWHLNRRSVSSAVAIALFCAYLPMPGETVVAVALALLARANLPISVVLVWISNPLTWLPMFAPAYYVGAWIVGEPTIPIEHLTLARIGRNLGALWIGSLIFGVVLGVAGYVFVRFFWRYFIVKSWHLRRHRRRQPRQPSNDPQVRRR
jgi:hypothetical protein